MKVVKISLWILNRVFRPIFLYLVEIVQVSSDELELQLSNFSTLEERIVVLRHFGVRPVLIHTADLVIHVFINDWLTVLGFSLKVLALLEQVVDGHEDAGQLRDPVQLLGACLLLFVPQLLLADSNRLELLVLLGDLVG